MDLYCTKVLQGRTHYTTDRFKCIAQVYYLGQTKNRQGRKIDQFVKKNGDNFIQGTVCVENL